MNAAQQFRGWAIVAGVSFISLVALCAGAAAQASEPVRETRAITKPFESVRLGGAVDLVLIQGDQTSVVVEADPSLQPHVRTEVKNGTLVVALEGMHWTVLGAHKPRIYVTTRTLSQISLDGAGDLNVATWTTPSDLGLALSGSGDMKFDHLSAKKILVRISGSGDVRLSGAVTEQEVRIAGAADYHAADLKSATTSVSIAGSADAVVWATQALEVSIAGVGDVQYYGRPTVSRSVAGIGDVKSLGDKN